jgi:hypothetical protein
LPFFGNNDKPILKSSGANAFKTGYGRNAENSENNDIIKIISKVSSHVVWNNAITWDPGNIGEDAYNPVNYSFNIYNDTLEHAMTNLAFIWSFGSTTQSVTDLVMLRPPYVYDIEIPGGVRFKYCTCGFEVRPGGKTRKFTSIKQDGMTKNDDEVCKVFKELYGVDVNPVAFSHVPDYYTVSITFRSLLPNTWNFVDSFLHHGDTAPQNGVELRHMLAKFTAGFSENG